MPDYLGATSPSPYNFERYRDAVDFEAYPDLTVRRVPVVHDTHTFQFHVALLVDEDPVPDRFRPHGPTEPVTEAEQDILVAFLAYRMEYYNERWRQQMLAEPFDIDDTVNTWTFRKTAERGWQYNAMTWRIGPTWVPGPDDKWAPEGYRDLVDILDRATGGHGQPAEGWARYKAEHPDLFPAEIG